MRRQKNADPIGLMRAGWDMARLIGEAQMVIGMRMLGMAGLWTVKPSENLLMLTEKQAAFTRMWMATATATGKGASPDAVLRAAIKPLRQKTAPNVRRLARAGSRPFPKR
ncbi:antifreeze protein [Rhodobacteraceae bacterium 2CG4]|uniref:Antifreeze protein n=1 Tax=Halovulum marinum TaxID=2662447 RepID=A0A6L5Z0T7_9RHOB|nr:antifreeze protein [Halovulum marinum]MSU90176.1 antifreeze protein [Halovulum marinum]